MQSQKIMIPVRFQGKPFNITVIQVYAPTTDTEEAEDDRFCEDIIPSRTNTKKKKCPSGMQKQELKRYLE